MLCMILYWLMVVLAINTALKTARQNLQKYLPPLPPKADVNLKTGQIVYDDIMPWSLYTTLLLYARCLLLSFC